MNGRVYDPTLGRFLSADPNIDGAYDSQGYNRYSYVGNNPMNATDPTGYFKLSFKTILKIVAVVVIAYFTAGWGAQAMGGWFSSTLGVSTAVGNGIAGGLAAGFSSGFAGSLLNGGSIGDAFKAGVIGGIAGAITGGIAGKIGDIFGDVANGSFGNEFGRALSHGSVGGVAEEIQGGSFRHGFYAGFAGSAAGSVVGRTALQNIEGAKGVAARTAIVATAAGTASALGGGKFANGAITAAFQHLFNAEAHRGNWFQRAGRRAGEFYDDYVVPAAEGARDGAMAFADGMIPFYDPLAEGGYYNANDESLMMSQALGQSSRNLAGSLAVTARAGAWLGSTRLGHALNHNRWFRMGPGRMPSSNAPFQRLPAGPKVPRISIGPQRPGAPNPHIDLRFPGID